VPPQANKRLAIATVEIETRHICKNLPVEMIATLVTSQNSRAIKNSGKNTSIPKVRAERQFLQGA
jgi:hypothetical protein